MRTSIRNGRQIMHAHCVSAALNVLACDYNEHLYKTGKLAPAFDSSGIMTKRRDKEVSTSQTLRLMLAVIAIVMPHCHLTPVCPRRQRPNGGLRGCLCRSIEIVVCFCQPVLPEQITNHAKTAAERGANKIQMFYSAVDIRSTSLDSPISIDQLKKYLLLW